MIKYSTTPNGGASLGASSTNIECYTLTFSLTNYLLSITFFTMTAICCHQFFKFQKLDQRWSIQKTFHLIVGLSCFFHGIEFLVDPIGFCFLQCWTTWCQYSVIIFPSCIDFTLFVELVFLFAEEAYKTQAAAHLHKVLNRNRFISFFLNISIYVYSFIFVGLMFLSETNQQRILYQKVWSYIFSVSALCACIGFFIYGRKVRNIVGRMLRSRSTIKRIRTVGFLTLGVSVCFLFRALWGFYINLPGTQNTFQSNHSLWIAWILYSFFAVIIPNVMILRVFHKLPPLYRKDESTMIHDAGIQSSAPAILARRESNIDTYPFSTNQNGLVGTSDSQLYQNSFNDEYEDFNNSPHTPVHFGHQDTSPTEIDHNYSNSGFRSSNINDLDPRTAQPPNAFSPFKPKVFEGSPMTHTPLYKSFGRMIEDTQSEYTGENPEWDSSHPLPNTSNPSPSSQPYRSTIFNPINQNYGSVNPPR